MVHRSRTCEPPQPIRRAVSACIRAGCANIDEGWTRWLLEQVRVPLHDAGRPRCPRRRSSQRVRRHHPAAPAAERRSSAATSPPRRPGAMGPRTRCPRSTRAGSARPAWRLEALRRRGGTLVTLDEASDLALERFGGVFDRIRDVTRGLDRTVSTARGPWCASRRHQPAGGVGDGAARRAAYFQGSRAFDTADPPRGASRATRRPTTCS